MDNTTVCWYTLPLSDRVVTSGTAATSVVARFRVCYNRAGQVVDLSSAHPSVHMHISVHSSNLPRLHRNATTSNQGS